MRRRRQAPCGLWLMGCGVLLWVCCMPRQLFLTAVGLLLVLAGLWALIKK